MSDNNSDRIVVKEAIKFLKEYIDTYPGFTTISATTSTDIFLADMLYGLGLALDSEKYGATDGFRKFLANEVWPIIDKTAKKEVFIYKLKNEKD